MSDQRIEFPLASHLQINVEWDIPIELTLSSPCANDALSIADPFALAYVEQVNAIDFPLDDFPRVKDWFERLEALESTSRARAKVQPHVQAMMSS